MRNRLEHTWAIAITWNIGEIIVWILKILPQLALFVSFVLSTIISILVIRFYVNKHRLHNLEIKAKELECKKLGVEIQANELILKKKDEFQLKK